MRYYATPKIIKDDLKRKQIVQPAEHLLAAIVSAAMTFSQSGLCKVSLDDLCATLKMSKSTLYRYVAMNPGEDLAYERRSG